ncbi:hypothetical protein K0504_12935 [Neiella marina]|uniref:Uncharacterized protein n=1 Tax=Neiella holothuriorum TaxID=2870530 RepID=A0ABS7EHX6_9GAMM|nr:hypothetical protein [Neiella holothuriorum]MBW8191944.1 hypothetical protein [Neiella holothuriorum]
MPLDFYEELLNNKRFCESLGRLLLLSGKLESALKKLLDENGVKIRTRATLGELVGACQKNGLTNLDLDDLFTFIVTRRNYLTHNLYPLFNEEIEVTLLPREDLCPDDADYYFPKCVNDLISYIEFTIKHIAVVSNDT